MASDERMQQTVQKGKAIAHPELGHAVHVEVAGLEPARDYFYRFSVGSERSATGDAQSFNLNQGKAVSYSATNTTYSTRAFAVRKR